MNEATHHVEINLVSQHCIECGMLFAMPADVFERQYREQGKYFHCPEGHLQRFVESRKESLERMAGTLSDTRAELVKLRQYCLQLEARIEGTD